jgi:hypothetical protein
MPPPAQRPATQRAAQLPARQLPLDHCPVTVYREHDASKRQPSGPPRGLRQKDNGEGRATSDAPTVPAPAPGCNPATHRPVGKAPPPTQSRPAARPLHPHRHPQRRFPAPAIRILSAVEHHGLRHSMAVTTLLEWCRDGGDVRARIPQLSAMLGHSGPRDTYYYLHAAPELLALAGQRLTAYLEEPS